MDSTFETMMEVSTELLTLFFFLAFLAEVVGTISGFGSSILFVPIASFFFDFKTVLGITSAFHVFSNLFKVYLFRSGVDRKIVLQLGLPAVVFVIIGAFLSNVIPQKKLEFGMNVFVLLLAVVLLVLSRIKLKQSSANLVTGGVLSGFLAGIIGTGGSIRGLTLAAFGLSKDVFIATSALIDLGVDTGRAGVYFFNGYFSKELMVLVVLLIPISLLGTWTGKKLLEKINEKYFKRFVLLLIIVASLGQLAVYFSRI